MKLVPSMSALAVVAALVIVGAGAGVKLASGGERPPATPVPPPSSERSDFGLDVSNVWIPGPAGDQVCYRIAVDRATGLTEPVILTASGPSGLTFQFSPVDANDGSVLTVDTVGLRTPGDYAVTVTGRSGHLSREIAVGLVVGRRPAPTASPGPAATPSPVASRTPQPTPRSTTSPLPPADFSLRLDPALQDVKPGTTATVQATVEPLNGSGGPVTLQVEGQSATVQATPGKAVPLTLAGPTAPGTRTSSVTGTSGGLSHLATADVRVPFTLAVDLTTTNPACGDGTPVMCLDNRFPDGTVRVTVQKAPDVPWPTLSAAAGPLPSSFDGPPPATLTISLGAYDPCARGPGAFPVSVVAAGEGVTEQVAGPTVTAHCFRGG